MNNIVKRFTRGIVASAAIGLASTSFAEAPVERTMCLWDPIGASGPIYQALKDYQVSALKWGVKLNLKVYTADVVAAEDFKAGICDMVNLPGILARSYVPFAGTIDAIGAIPTYDHLKVILETFASAKAAKYMTSGEYEVVSVVPLGAAYAFMADRSTTTIADLAGKKIPVLDNAPEIQMFVAQAGMTPVSATLATMFSKFNNHAVDLTAAPAIAFEPLELHKGLEPNGGIIEFPLIQITLQLLSRKARLPEGFGQSSREYAVSNFDDAVKVIRQSETSIPKKYWITIPEDKKIGWTELFRLNRIALRDKGIYDGKALTVFRKIRCSKEPDLAECTAADKE